MPSSIKKKFQKTDTKESASWLLVFLTGFIIGVLFVNLWDKSDRIQEGIVSIDTILRLKHFEINRGHLFTYVLEERFKVICIMVLLATTIIGIFASYCYIGWLGLSLGILMSVMTLRFGLRGTVLFFCCVFPHYLIYIPVSIAFVNWCVDICARLHFPHLLSGGRGGSRKQQMIHASIRLFLLIGVVIIGCVIECYVNPIFLNKIVKIF